MRLLWAEAIDDMRTAMVIDTQQGSLLGGVVLMMNFEMQFGRPRANRGIDGILRVEIIDDARTKMELMWEWYRVVDSADAFRRSREWEKRLSAPLKQIEHAPIQPSD